MSLQGAFFSGNVYTMGTNTPLADDYFKKLSPNAKHKTETKELYTGNYNADAELVKDKNGVYLDISFDHAWLTRYKRSLVTTALLGNALVPGLPFENPDGSPVRVDTDYAGRPRDTANPSPGPFEITRSGRQRIRLW